MVVLLDMLLLITLWTGVLPSGIFYKNILYTLTLLEVNFDFNRTLVIKDGVAYGQAGAGIVYDSDPESEYKETMTKMMGGLRAVFRAEAYGGVTVRLPLFYYAKYLFFNAYFIRMQEVWCIQ